LVGLLLPPLWANRRALRQWRPNFVWDARVGIGFALTGLFLGSYWYLRNWTHSGNPFGFLSIEIFGLELFAGETTRAELGRTAISSMFHVTSGDDWSVLWQVGRDWLGIGFAFLLVAFFFLRRDSSRLLPTLLITALLSFVAYWTAPYSGDNGNRGYQLTPWMNVGLRYAYPLFSAIAVTAALGFDRARLRGKIALVLPVLIAAYALMWKLKIGGVALRYAVGMGLPLSFYLLRWHSLPAWARRGYVYGPVVVALLAVFVIKSQDLRELREHQRRQNYGVLHSYMEQKVGRRATVAYMRTHRRYQLFGNTLSREIVWIVPESDDPKAWIRQLREASVEWVAVGTADQTEAAREGIVDVRPWLEENTDDFQLYFPAQNSKKDVALYRLIGD